jgi:O-antigen ligase
MFSQNPISKNIVLNVLISIIPITYILGNLLLNLNIFLILLISFFIFKLDFFRLKLNLIDYLIIIFFSYITINAAYNNYFNFSYENTENVILFKALAYLRFLLLYFVIRLLIHHNQIKYKLIFLSFGLLALFVSADIIFQYFFRIDLLGFEVPENARRLGGPFGNELIAGSFIQRFYIFLIFYILIFSKYKKNWKFHLVSLLLILIFTLGTTMSGNRIPLIMYFLSLILITVFEKFFRKDLIIISLIILVATFGYIKHNENSKYHLGGFLINTELIFDYFKKKYSTSNDEQENLITNSYIREFEAGISTWEKNKLFGGGIKSFYYTCSTIDKKILSDYGGCPSHPHNYYIQLSAELGLVGLFFTILLFVSIIFRSLKAIYSDQRMHDKMLLIPFAILLLLEIFPFKTTGSFFTTTNSTFLFIVIPFIVGLSELKKNKYYG